MRIQTQRGAKGDLSAYGSLTGGGHARSHYFFDADAGEAERADQLQQQRRQQQQAAVALRNRSGLKSPQAAQRQLPQQPGQEQAPASASGQGEGRRRGSSGGLSVNTGPSADSGGGGRQSTRRQSQ